MKSLIPLSIRRFLGVRYEAWQAAQQKNRLLRSLAGDAVECNICGWVGACFTDDLWHPQTVCPQCGSQVRHRMLVAILDSKSTISGASQADLLAGKEILHFAPERQLRERIKATAKRHVTADFDRGDCDLKLDMSAMPSVADASYDVVIACDVLEHVPDDRAAMRELRRILRPNGTAILTVPQKDPPATTDEDPAVTAPTEREHRFGQKDHIRMFGDDFAIRLTDVGFQVTTLSIADFPPSIASRLILHPPQPNPHPLATNHRRIYLARV